MSTNIYIYICAYGYFCLFCFISRNADQWTGNTILVLDCNIINTINIRYNKTLALQEVEKSLGILGGFSTKLLSCINFLKFVCCFCLLPSYEYGNEHCTVLYCI